MSTFPHNPTFSDLIQTMATLRSEHGCAWDKEQTISSLKPYLLEESYEVLEAIENFETEQTPQTIANHCEELGDLLLQVLFQSRIQEENGHFSIHDVIKTLQEKLIRRHPHVFSEHKASYDTSSQAQIERWENIKKTEKQTKVNTPISALDGMAKTLPALLFAYEAGEKARKVGFDYNHISSVLADLKSEIREVEEALEQGNTLHAREEAGDVLYAAVSVCRHLKTNPEVTLRQSVLKFKKRFQHVEQQASQKQIDLKDCTENELIFMWKEAKIQT